MILHIVSTLEERRKDLHAAQENVRTISQLAAANLHSILKGASETLTGLASLPEITAMQPAQAEKLLRKTKNIVPDFEDILLLAPDGTVVASTFAADRTPLPGGDHPRVRQIQADQSTAIGGVLFGKSEDLPGMALARPVHDPQGRTIGMCMLTLNPDWFTRTFSASALPPTTEACLRTEQGLALAVWPERSPLPDCPLPASRPAASGHTHAAGEVFLGPGTDGSQFLLAEAPVLGDGHHQLSLRLGRAESAITTPLERAITINISILGLAVATVFCLTLAFSRTALLDPMERLVCMARAMAQGDLNSRSGIGPGHGEISALGQALDTMADKLRERIRFTQDLIDAIPAPVFYKGLDGRYLGCNKEYEERVRPLPTMLGRTAREIEPPALARSCEETDQAVLASPGHPMQFETPITLTDGLPHDMLVTKSTFANAMGMVAGIVGVSLDITSFKRSELARSDSEEKYHTLLASMRDGFAVMDREGRIVESNPAFQEMLGYTAEELVRVSYRDITPEIWHAAEEAVLHTTVDARGFSDIFEKEYRRQNGSIVPVALRLHRYPSRADATRRYFAIVRDITADKALEADLRAAKETAETANRAKSDFLAKMSHDIRTPLNAVIGMTELTLGTPLSPQQRDALETVRESANALLGLISDILDISKIEARKLELTREPFDLRRTLATIIRSMRSQARAGGIALTLAIDPQTPRYVIGDQLRLRQVLLNLVGNGLKFTRQGFVSLAVAPAPGQSDTSNPASIAFTVADSGIGIPTPKLDHIFEMFTQADATITRQYGGTGLGLAICRELVRLMGGFIVAASEPGHGSHFRVTLPLPRTNVPPEATPPPPETTVPAATPVSRLRILLVEDNPINIKVATTFLTRRGHDFAVAENGNAALELLAAASFDVVLMDVEMPDMDGLEATRRLRRGMAGPCNKDTPVVAMTAHALSGVRQRCLEAGMTDYLAKPLDFQALDALLAKLARAAQATLPPIGCSPDTPLVSVPDLDTKKALDRLGGDQELLGELQNDFLSQYPRKLRLITACAGNENWSEATLAAHSLKNLAGAIGAEASWRLAGRLEDHLRRVESDAAYTTLARLEAALSLVAAKIRQKTDPARTPPSPV